MPLPSLDRPTPEARLGLPELAGMWRFAGWEVIRGDSAALERTFPSFGELALSTQRLDSIAGTFVLGGSRVPVVGEVRRDGEVAIVTYVEGTPGSFIAGRVQRDTLWLELTSVLAADEWPRDARAAFVRSPVLEPIAWLRGARPGDLEPEVPVDSAESVDPSGPLTPEPQPTAPQPPASGTQPGPTEQPSQPQPSGPTPQPAPSTQPSPQPTPEQVPPSEPPAQAQPEPEPEPDAQPEPEPQPEPEAEQEGPRLLGEPVDPLD